MLVAMSAACAFGVVTADVNVKTVMVEAINNFFILKTFKLMSL
jgi:hypothetical protein